MVIEHGEYPLKLTFGVDMTQGIAVIYHREEVFIGALVNKSGNEELFNGGFR